MDEAPDPRPSDAPAPDPELVELMRDRVVRRKSSAPKSPKAGPGRPKGQPKTGGKVAGRPNLMSPEFREWLANKARPFELLAAVCAGEEIEDGGVKRKPTLAERTKAAETLGRKLVPDLSAAALSGPNGGPMEFTTPMPPKELSRRLLAVIHEVSGVSGLPTRPAPPVIDAEIVEPAPPPAPAAPPEPQGPAVGHEEPLGVSGIFARLEERLPDGRERWTARDLRGQIVKTAFGRQALEASVKGKP